MKIQMKFICDFGEFTSEIMSLTYEEYLGLTEVSKNFYQNELGFDMWMEKGFFVAPPSVVQRSVLLINIIENEG